MGLMMSLWVLSSILCKKEDTMGQEDSDVIDLQGTEKMAEMVEKGRVMGGKRFSNETQIKTVVVGNFLELVEIGLLKLSVPRIQTTFSD